VEVENGKCIKKGCGSLPLLTTEARASAEKFPRGGGATEKRPKNCKKKPEKIALLSLFQGGNRKNDQKIAKKHRKIALLSLYLLYLYHV